MWETLRSRLVDADVEAHRQAHERFVERERMPRAAERRDSLAEFLARPPLTPLATEPATATLGDLLEREARRVVRRSSKIDTVNDPESLHAVRKAATRLRYAAEALTEEPVPLFGDDARDLADAGDDLHDVLGDHRDEVLFAEHVRRASGHAAHDGEPVEIFERLAEAADQRAAERLGELATAVRKLRHAERSWSSR